MKKQWLKHLEKAKRAYALELKQKGKGSEVITRYFIRKERVQVGEEQREHFGPDDKSSDGRERDPGD